MTDPAQLSEITEGGALQQFVLLAKKAKGKAVAAIIEKALGAPNVYVFGELLDMENVKQLAETEDKKFLDLLKIFAYGTYAHYKAQITQFPQLTPPQIKKLRQLSIVSLSAENKLISYAALQQQLDIIEVRELEDLIIDAIYQGIMQAKLDQKSKQLEVQFSMGRDLKPDSIDQMINTLTSWSVQSENLMKTIKDKIAHANFMNDQDKKHKEDFEKRVEQLKINLKAAMEAEMLQASEFEGGEFFEGGERKRAGGRPKMPKGHRNEPPHHRDRRGM